MGSTEEFDKLLELLGAYGSAANSVLNVQKAVENADETISSLTEKEKNCEIKEKDVIFMKKHIIGGKLKIHPENAEVLLNKNPSIFEGIELEIIDVNDDNYFEE